MVVRMGYREQPPDDQEIKIQKLFAFFFIKTKETSDEKITDDHCHDWRSNFINPNQCGGRYKTKSHFYLEAASLTNDKAVMYQAPYYTETDRGLIPEYDSKFNVASWNGWLTYDALKTAEKKDEATIKTIVESVGTLADTGNFEALEKLYAPEVELDYTSLAGGEVQLKSPQAIMTQWAGVLPGFDRTRHDVSNIKVSSNGETATATADITADHNVSQAKTT